MRTTVAESQIALACALDESAARVSGELRGLVDAARLVSRLPDPRIDPAFASRLESRLLTEQIEGVAVRRLTIAARPSLTPSKANDEAAAPAAVITLPRRRLVVRKALVAAVAAASLTALPVAASASALPGTPMYPVKQSLERVELVLAIGKVADGFVHLKHAARRLDETDQLVAMDATRLVPATLDRMNHSLKIGTSLILENTSDAETLERVAATLHRSNRKLTTLLDEAPQAVQHAIFESLATGHALTAEVQQALGTPAALRAPAPPAQPPLGDANASWSVPRVDAVALANDADVAVSGGSSGAAKGGSSKPGQDDHESKDTASSCRAHTYDGPQKELVHGACEATDVNAQIDPPKLSAER